MKNLLCFFTVCFLAISLIAQPNIEWKYLLGGYGQDVGQTSLQTSDGGYIIAGISLSPNTPGAHGIAGDILVMKTDAVGHVQWQRSYGGTGTEFQPRIEQTSDGGYFFIAISASTDGDVLGNHGSYDGWAVKLSDTGAIQWQSAIGGSEGDYVYDFSQTSDGGYIVAGGTYSSNGDILFNHGLQDLFILKLSDTGSVQWKKTLGGSSDDTALLIQQTSDGGYIVGGRTYSNDGNVSGNHGKCDIWMLKFNDSGQLQWEKTLGGSEDEYLASMQQTNDGGYIVAGSTWSNDQDVSGNHGEKDFWVVKLSGGGIIDWQKVLGGSKDESLGSLKPSTDGGYFLTGFTKSNDGDVSGQHGAADCWLVKLTDDGELQWQKTLGGSENDQMVAGQLTSDGGIVMAGNSKSYNGDVTGNQGLEDVWIVKVSALGEIQWKKSLGGNKYDEANSILQTSDGGYFVAGLSLSNNGDVSGQHGNGDFFVIKIAPDVVGIKNTPAPDPTAQLKVFPNPSNETVSLQIESEESIMTVLIVDFLGRPVMDQTISNGGTLDISTLPNGIYTVLATTPSGKVFSNKISKQE